MIFISTGGRRDLSGGDHAELLVDNGFNAIEVSSGKYEEFQLDKLKRLRNHASISLHNYYPPPKMGFVFNLASTNSEVAESSMKLVENALQWSSELCSKYYSFHAGFLLDPSVDELGKKVLCRQLTDRDLGMQLFLDRVNLLAEKARILGVELLIENNVLTSSNFNVFKENPFLVATPDEAVSVMRNTPQNVNLLVDVAHLYVSSKTLNFAPETYFKLCDEWISGYHLSDNDGTADKNEPITNKSWFWGHIKSGLDVYTIEVYNTELGVLHEQCKLIESVIGD
jgi:sugar phosphate isomerase/epimerase